VTGGGRAGSTAGEWFAGMVSEYDSLIRRAVPRYEEMTGELVACLPSAATRVLELGCGTGNFSLALAARYPYAALTTVDAALEMTDVTRDRITRAHPDVASRARFITARFEELSLNDERYDLITSCISLHHVSDKEALFRVLRQALTPGGRLCFADQMRADPEEMNRRNWNAWLAFCRQPGNCTDEEVERLVEHAAAHDHYETVAQHLGMLERAGFTELDCLWRSGMWAIVTATS
jgi:tRNA (cmo5U34)-methyltransferase